MHCLSGTYLKSCGEDVISDGKDPKSAKQFYPLKIIIPPNKSRLMYFVNARDQNIWH